MVAVEMRDEDRRDAVGVDAAPVETDDAGGTAVDQKAMVPPVRTKIDMIAGLEPPAGAEGVATPNDRQLHGDHL